MMKGFKRDGNGLIDLNFLEESEHILIGRKEKIWLKDEKDQEYLFKYGASNYEIWAEILAEDIGKQCGIEMAHYEPAKYKNYIGVVTPNFVERNMYITSAERFRKNQLKIMDESNIKTGNHLKGTNLDVVMTSFMFNTNLTNEEYNEILFELQKRWCFWQLIMEGDKNLTNISFIHNGWKYKLSPDYDNSTMVRLNENVAEFLKNIRTKDQIVKMTDEIEQSLALDIENDNTFYTSFTRFCELYPENAEKIMKDFENLDLDMVFETREALLSENESKTLIEIPWEIKYWLKKAIPLRQEDMKTILNKQLQQKNSKK